MEVEVFFSTLVPVACNNLITRGSPKFKNAKYTMFDLEKFLAADNNLIFIRRINNIPWALKRVFKIKAVFYYVKLT